MEEVKVRSIGSAENKMGVMPIMKLILNMSLPMMFSMLIMALYNIVDSIFVAKINEDALTAVSLAFPIQNLMISFAVGTGVGVNALLSKRLGQRNQEDVNKTAMNAVFLAACNFIVFFYCGDCTGTPLSCLAGSRRRNCYLRGSVFGYCAPYVVCALFRYYVRPAAPIDGTDVVYNVLAAFRRYFQCHIRPAADIRDWAVS